MIWTEGKIIPPEEVRVDVRDATFQHGLGLFETFRTWKGSPTLFHRHLQRMRRSARDLELGLHSDQLPDLDQVHRLIAAHHQAAPAPVGDVRLRITLSGGRAARGAGPERPSLWMSAGTLESPTARRVALIKRTMQVPVDDPLARHKTLNYWRKRLALAQAFEEGADEVLCVTPDGLVCEGAGTNFFLVLGTRLITPDTDGPLLPGIMRSVVLERAGPLGFEVVEGPVPLPSLEAADEAFLTNSVRGMLPIARLFGRTLPAPGPATRRIWSDILPWLESGGTTR
jgi:branched-subunit amino acid aminotransferase/4-amino-4-deoxychorismate lyase